VQAVAGGKLYGAPAVVVVTLPAEAVAQQQAPPPQPAYYDVNGYATAWPAVPLYDPFMYYSTGFGPGGWLRRWLERRVDGRLDLVGGYWLLGALVSLD
jgi:hypothetical protein